LSVHEYFCEKYGLTEILFDGSTYSNTLICIVLKSTSRIEVFNYIEHLESLHDDLLVEFSETKFTEYFLLKYQKTIRSNFKTGKKFELEFFNDKSVEFRIYKINEEKRQVFFKQFKQKEMLIPKSLVSEYMGDIISKDFDNDKIQVVEYLLKNNYKKLKFKYTNEFNFSSMMVMVLTSFSNDCLSQNSFVYSFEKVMILEEFKRICDAIYIHENILAIFEFKSNVYKKEDPLEYIGDRNYVSHVIEYFEKYEPDVLKNINVVKQIGLEFFGRNKKHKVKIILAEDLNISEIQHKKHSNTDESEMKFINKKRKLQRKKINQSIY
jgi:hypothetical protein